MRAAKSSGGIVMQLDAGHRGSQRINRARRAPFAWARPEERRGTRDCGICTSLRTIFKFERRSSFGMRISAGPRQHKYRSAHPGCAPESGSKRPRWILGCTRCSLGCRRRTSLINSTSCFEVWMWHTTSTLPHFPAQLCSPRLLTRRTECDAKRHNFSRHHFKTHLPSRARLVARQTVQW